MTDIFKQVSQRLLSPSDIDMRHVESILSGALMGSVDAADIFFQSSQDESWLLEDGIVKEGGFSQDKGFGMRVMSGEKTGFAYADNIDMAALAQAANNAKSIVSHGQSRVAKLDRQQSSPVYYGMHNPLTSLQEQEKVALLQRIDRQARDKDPRIKTVIVRLNASDDHVMVMHSDGTVSSDIRPIVNLSIRVIAEAHGRREQGASGGGARADYHFFTDDRIDTYVERAVNQALRNLEAIPAPAGTMPVVLGPGWPAVILHEAVGHGLEGDFNRKGTSAFSGKVGEAVASSLCSIVDDGTLPNHRGSLNVDDEGTPSQQTMLIDKGRLVQYMQDKHNAQLMGVKSTGNGRRESYSMLPIPRMTNTYMLPGEHEPGEIVESVKEGLYVKDLSGGQVDITSGKFVFSTSEAYLIKDGVISAVPVKGATLIGNGPDVLHKVSMVGNDLKMDSGQGYCGKAGQSVPVGVGQPTIKVDALTVGGRAG